MRSAMSGFVVEDFRPAYSTCSIRNTLQSRVCQAIASLQCCRACPRQCQIDRLNGQTGFCRTGRKARVASAFAHMGEENCLRGWRGSGTIFFGRCNLRCVFCQNADISQQDAGIESDAEQLADLMLQLQGQGCHNINLVTPEHVVPQVVEALGRAIERGLKLPVVYNTSAYDSPESLAQLDGLIDIYMPDFKLWSEELCARYLGARDYAQAARQAIAEMHRQVGPLRFTAEGLACRGLLVRHLVMPGLLSESAAIFRFLAQEVSPDTYVNIMGQYHPDNLVGLPANTERKGRSPVQFEEINRRITARELAEAYDLARQSGLWRFDKRAA